jgi:hypothetical protein
VSLRSHGSLSLNRALITGSAGTDPVLGGAADFDLELLEHRTLDGHIQELVYRPTPHVSRHETITRG